MKRVLGLVTALMFSSPVAAIYKCVDAEGNVGFSEVPCAAEEEASTVNIGASGPRVDEHACELATLYAEDVFKRMRGNGDSSRELDRYGGIYGAGSAILGVVNYVYGFRHDENASARRVASLTRSKCENGGFGRIRFEELPRDEYYVFDEYQQAWVRKGEGGGYPQTRRPSTTLTPQRAMPAATSGNTRTSNRRRCEQIMAAIDDIDTRMRNGYSAGQGEMMRERRRTLRNQAQAACR